MKKFRIRELRTARGITQTELARALCIDNASVCMWESGNTIPTADKLPTIAAVLGCEVGELYDEDALREAARAAEARKEA